MNRLNHFFKQARRMIPICLATIICVGLMGVQAQAHKVNVFAYMEGDRVVVEGYFGGNVKAQDSEVQVFDETGKKVLEGKTDQKGLYSFNLSDLPAFSGGLRVVLEGGMGHKADYTLSPSDIPGSVKEDPPPKEQPRTNKSEDTTGLVVAGSNRIAVQADLTTALETALDRKLDPLVRMLGKQERLLLEQQDGGPRITDIVGGIGWIVGLVGLTAFFWGRNRSAKKSFE